jgi:hypothetical protein
MTKIAKATKLEGEAMKTIAFVTMLYLPETFVAVSSGKFLFKIVR